MRFVVDASFLVLNRASGIRTYTWNLLQALRDELADDELVAFYRYARGECPVAELAGIRSCVLRLPRRPLELAWRYLDRPALDRFLPRIDVFHAVHMVLPPVRRAARVLTVHDLREFVFPELYPHLQPLRAMRTAMARRADRIITISESTRRDAIHYMGLAPEKVCVVHNGCDAKSEPPADAAAIRGRLGLDRPYVLFLSSMDPRKGIADAAAAFSLAAERGLDGFRLAVVGAVPEAARSQLAALGDRAVVTGILPDPELRAVMAGASCLLFSSLHEGFGLPILEAFAVSLPVVAYDHSAIPEVAGDAALLAPPRDVGALAGALIQAATDGSARERMMAAGRRRCEAFQWSAAARRMAAVYREAAAEHAEGRKG